MKKFKVSGSYRAYFSKIIEAETENEAWNEAEKLEIQDIDSDDENDWNDFDIDDVCEIKI